MSTRRRAPTGAELASIVALGGQRLRNMCVLGHVDHGKSSLVDWLIAENGVIPQRLAGQLRYLDDTAEEQARGITMRASAISIVYAHDGAQPRKEWGGGEAEDDRRYAVTLIDSPGHIDFSSDATAATRLCDGCVVVVDAMEGLRIQSHAALRTACFERARPVLFINKLDRLAVDDVATATEAWDRLNRLVESANVSMFGALSACVPDDAERDALVEGWKFAAEAGNVVFGSALDGWAFTLPQIAGLLAPQLQVPRKALVAVLFGEFAWRAADGKVVRRTTQQQAPIFADLVLEPIWALYRLAKETKKNKSSSSASPSAANGGGDPIAALVASLQVLSRQADDATETPHLLQAMMMLTAAAPATKSPASDHDAAKALLRRHLPIARAVLRAVVLTVPPPSVAQGHRLAVLLPSCDDAASLAAVAACDASPAAPVIVYVSKLARLGDDAGNIYAFGRVFAGTLRPGDTLTVFPDGAARLHTSGGGGVPSNNKGGGGGSGDNDAPRRVVVAAGEIHAMMGSGLVTLAEARAGQVVALGPDVVARAMRCKRATLVKRADGGPMATLGGVVSMAPQSSSRFARQQQQPVVRVAVDVVRQSDTEALDRGLVLLDQLSAAASVEISAQGERIVGAVGELHLETCLKDLRERYACCDLAVSKPIVGFREGCFPDDDPAVAATTTTKRPQLHTAPWSEEEGLRLTEDDEAVLFLTVRCVAMPRSLATALCRAEVQDDHKSAPALVRGMLDREAREALAAHKVLSRLIPDRVLASGPRDARGCLLVLDGDDAPNKHHPALVSAVVSGFELACATGPLADEPMHAVVFLASLDGSGAGDDDRFNPGAVMAAAKRACRVALLKTRCRLYEATLECELHCAREHLGAMYGLLSKRRARVLDDDVVEGTDVFAVRASIPARDALGFGNELLEWTSGGATAPQMRFDDFEPVDDDPFWRPTTLEEREEHGELELEKNYARTFINEVRIRKGLPTEMVLVDSAEKQRSRAGIRG